MVMILETTFSDVCIFFIKYKIQIKYIIIQYIINPGSGRASLNVHKLWHLQKVPKGPPPQNLHQFLFSVACLMAQTKVATLYLYITSIHLNIFDHWSSYMRPKKPEIAVKLRPERD